MYTDSILASPFTGWDVVTNTHTLSLTIPVIHTVIHSHSMWHKTIFISVCFDAWSSQSARSTAFECVQFNPKRVCLVLKNAYYLT